jgi:hypothetical protein
MAHSGVLHQDFECACKRAFEAETEAPTDSDSGFDSDTAGVCKAQDLDNVSLGSRFVQTDLVVSSRFSGLEPMRLLVAGNRSPQAFPHGEPMKLFDFDHLAPKVLQPHALQHTSCITAPSASLAIPETGFSRSSPTPVQVIHHPPSRGNSSFMSIRWTVDARKLNSKDNVVVSPSFDLLLAQPTPFKIMLRPKEMSSRKGGHSFQKSRGLGIVLLKCEVGLPDGFANLTLRSSVGRAPFARNQVHDFSQSGVCSMSQEWSFSQAVNEATRSFIVKVEVSRAVQVR